MRVVTLDVPLSFASELEKYSIDDNVNGSFVYEVVSKSSDGVELRVKNIIFTPKKRIV